jgi:hypothetical protein
VTEKRSLAEDRLPGIGAIARYTGESYRQAQHKVEKGVYPDRHGKIVIGLKSEIDRVHKPNAAGKFTSEKTTA